MKPLRDRFTEVEVNGCTGLGFLQVFCAAHLNVFAYKFVYNVKRANAHRIVDYFLITAILSNKICKLNVDFV